MKILSKDVFVTVSRMFDIHQSVDLSALNQQVWVECCTDHKDLLVAAWKNSKLLLKIDCSEDALV